MRLLAWMGSGGVELGWAGLGCVGRDEGGASLTNRGLIHRARQRQLEPPSAHECQAELTRVRPHIQCHASARFFVHCMNHQRQHADVLRQLILRRHGARGGGWDGGEGWGWGSRWGRWSRSRSRWRCLHRCGCGHWHWHWHWRRCRCRSRWNCWRRQWIQGHHRGRFAGWRCHLCLYCLALLRLRLRRLR